MRITAEREPKISKISIEQEQQLVDDRRLLVVAYGCINYWSFNEIYDFFDYTTSELIGYLIQLEKMKMINFGLDNKITPTISAKFLWHPNGPIDNFFLTEVSPEFFDSTFSGENEVRLAKNGEITEKSRTLLNRRIEALGEYFDELCFKDRNEELHKSRSRTSLVIASRQWDWSLFEKLKRK